MANYKVFYTSQGKAKLQYDVIQAGNAEAAGRELERLAKMMEWQVRVVHIVETNLQPLG